MNISSFFVVYLPIDNDLNRYEFHWCVKQKRELAKDLLSNRLLDNFVRWIREVADLSHMGVDTRMYIKRETSTNR